MVDHPPRLRFSWLRKFTRGGGCWCFRIGGQGYGPYFTKAEADSDERGVARFLKKENSK